MPFDFENDVNVGDTVIFYPHIGSPDIATGIVAHKGFDSIECLIFAYVGDGVKPIYKSGIRHVTDPVQNDPLRMNAIMTFGDGGFFDLHPDKIRLRVLEDKVEELLISAGKPVPQKVIKRKPDPTVDLSFRMDDKIGPDLTEEQKAAKKAALQSVGV